MIGSDEEREVPMIDDTDLVVLPDQTSDEIDVDHRDVERQRLRDLQLIEDRPPHWDD